MKTNQYILAAMGLLFSASQAYAAVCVPPQAANDCDPPAGNVVLDLAGSPLPHSYTQYQVTFVATDPTTAISFQMREDPAFFHLDDIVLTHGGGANLLVNGDFEGGSYIDAVTGSTQPNGWTYLNLFRATASGSVATGAGAHSGEFYYDDGAVGAYDGITQGVVTTVGDLYSLSFWLTDTSSQELASRINGPTNGDEEGPSIRGIDLLVYAGALPTVLPTDPSTVPEPASIALLGLGMAGLAATRRRRSR